MQNPKHKMEVAVVIRSEGTNSAVVASLTPDDIGELIAINRAMVVGGVGVFVREQARLDALIQRISTVMQVETPTAA